MNNFGPNRKNARDNQDVLRIYIEALQKASSLDINESKLCLYYCMLTHKMEKLSIFPILTLFGQHSTGKSSTMKVMVQLVHEPKPDGKAMSNLDLWQGLKINDTFPSLRDGLEYGTTSFIEEGDADRKKNEQLLADRYSRQTATVRFKQEEKTGFSQGKAEIFGATVVHKRKGYKDPATASRSIFVTTKSEPDKIHHTTIFSDEERKRFQEIAHWANSYELSPSNRAQDLWYPLIGLAIEFGDGEWITWAQSHLQKQMQSQTSGGSFDPQQAVILGLLSLTVTEQANDSLQFIQGKYELKYIKNEIDQNLGVQMSISEIEFGLQQQGFEVKKRKGIPRVDVTKEKLKKACSELNIEDEALSALS